MVWWSSKADAHFCTSDEFYFQHYIIRFGNNWVDRTLTASEGFLLTISVRLVQYIVQQSDLRKKKMAFTFLSEQQKDKSQLPGLRKI